MARRIALLQVNPTVGDLDGNRTRLEALCAIADKAGADVAVATELAISGYPPRDLLLSEGFSERCLAACSGIETALPLLVGAPLPAKSSREKVGNGVLRILPDGEVRELTRKQLLPTYEVFDEARDFTPDSRPGIGRDIGGLSLGLTVCEDAWQHSGETPSDYDSDPILQLCAWQDQGEMLDATVNLSASPYHASKPEQRAGVVKAAAASLGHPFLLANQIGGNDDLLFDGRSLAAWPDGTTIEAPAWQEGVLIIDLDQSSRSFWLPWEQGVNYALSSNDMFNAVCAGLADYCRKSGLEKVVIGLSGGIDSALTAAVASAALGPSNVIGVSMPSRHSSDHSVSDAEALAESLGIEYQSRPLEELHQAAESTLKDELENGDPIASENLQARLRGMIIMGIANARKAMALATGNKSELAQGYCTLYGDMAGGYAPLGDLYKTEVYQLSEAFNQEAGKDLIPRSSIEKPPSAELAPEQKDEDTLPPYSLLDEILRNHIEHGMSSQEIASLGIDEGVVDEVISRLVRNEHKRWQMPPAPRVSTRAFGQGWRLPMAARRTNQSM